MERPKNEDDLKDGKEKKVNPKIEDSSKVKTYLYCHSTSDLEIVRSVSGNLNVFTEKFLPKEGIYWVENTQLCTEMFLMMGICSKKQQSC